MSRNGEGRCVGSAGGKLLPKGKLRDIPRDKVELVKKRFAGRSSVSRVKCDGSSLVMKSFDDDGHYANELAVARVVSHPYVVDYVGKDDVSKLLYTKLEVRDLKLYCVDVCKNEEGANRLAKQLVVILLQIAEAMRCVHEHGFVHGGLKPDNILVSSPSLCSSSEDIRVKLCDFGNSQDVQEYKCQGAPRESEAPEVGTWREYRDKNGAESEVDSQKFEDPQKIDTFFYGTLIHQLLHWIAGDFEPLKSEGFTGDFVPLKPLEPADFRWLEGSCDKTEALLSLARECRRLQPGERPSFLQICKILKELADVEIDGETRNIIPASHLRPRLDFRGALQSLASVWLAYS